MANRPWYQARFLVEDNDLRFDAIVTGTIDPDNAVIEIPPGYYFIHSDVAAESLIRALETALETAYPNSLFTVSFSISTGIITIAINAGTMSVAWNTGVYGTRFRDLLGYGADWGPLASKSGIQLAQGLIYAASRGFTNDMREGREKTVAAKRAESGAVAKIFKSGSRYDLDYTHEFERAVASSSPLYSGCYDREGTVVPWAWEDLIDACAGEPFRVYEDAATDGIGDYLGTFDLQEASVQKFKPAQKEAGVDDRRVVSIAAWRHVVAT